MLADSYPLQPRITEGYEPFFTGLLDFCADATIDEALAARIKTYVQGWLATHPLDAFDRFSDESYLRTYLGRCPRTHWEAIVMSWKAGNRTSIHAHPQFAGYYFADGEFQVEIFEQAGPTALKLANVVRVNGQEGFAAIGHPGRFDNHIHRITCLSATGPFAARLFRRCAARDDFRPKRFGIIPACYRHHAPPDARYSGESVSETINTQGSGYPDTDCPGGPYTDSELPRHGTTEV